ncbi:ABC transporter ATP-binding protein [Saccharopolyspora cebuensis]|uniref:ABC transporter ATP-binding protein n=1 Tax=Saccharopolyspora cebuensis TaxID=418759 RepID=A0ABV4CHX0_9PSEU
MSFRTRELSWHAGGALIVDGISTEVEPGRTLGLLGPNGSGKSSLLRLLAGLRRPSAGSVLLDERELGGFGRRELARRVAVVEQESSTELDLSVRDVVALGRTPHRTGWGGEHPDDAAAVRRALAATGLDGLAERRWHALSGGERQRTQIARALAQEPSELLLDEPTNHLDIAHQLELLALIRTLPLTTVVALHDLNLAAGYCDRLLVLAGGRAVAAGAPADVLTEDLVAEVYGVACEVVATPEGAPHIRFRGPVGR